MRARVANKGYGKMWYVCVYVCTVLTVYIIYSGHFPQLVIDVNVFASMHVFKCGPAG